MLIPYLIFLFIYSVYTLNDFEVSYYFKRKYPPPGPDEED
jgi:hypothetical protein